MPDLKFQPIGAEAVIANLRQECANLRTENQNTRAENELLRGANRIFLAENDELRAQVRRLEEERDLLLHKTPFSRQDRLAPEAEELLRLLRKKPLTKVQILKQTRTDSSLVAFFLGELQKKDMVASAGSTWEIMPDGTNYLIDCGSSGLPK